MTAISPSAIQSDVLRRLVAHWQRMRVAGACRRAPTSIRWMCRYRPRLLSLIEVQRDPLRFYFRLDGTKQVDLFGVDCTRRYLDEAMPTDHAAMAVASYLGGQWSCRAPRYHRRQIAFHERLIDYEIVILPFSNDGERVDLLMTGIVPDRPL